MFLLHPKGNGHVIAYSQEEKTLDGLIAGFCTAFNAYKDIENKKGDDFINTANHPKKYNEANSSHYLTRAQEEYIINYEDRFEKKWLKANPDYVKSLGLARPLLKIFPLHRRLSAKDFQIEELPHNKRVVQLPTNFSSDPSILFIDMIFPQERTVR